MTTDIPHILLVNPWIHDFAAYDFWAKPMGLLSIAGLLRHHGIRVSYIDCLDRFHPRAPGTDPAARHGRGPYLKTRIAKPSGLNDVNRHYSRYGILPSWFVEDLSRLDTPDLVLVTSLMTYWYPGVQETIKQIKSVFTKPHRARRHICPAVSRSRSRALRCRLCYQGVGRDELIFTRTEVYRLYNHPVV